jgi:glycosyltransferase involved in cell wall biosynthesis
MLRVSLITLGDPDRLTGGYLYHRRMAASAPDHDAAVSFISLRDTHFPFGVSDGRRRLRAASNADVIVVDSIGVWMLAPWVRAGHEPPLVAMSHQVPGGIDHGGIRSRLQAHLDLHVYRRARLVMVASETLAADLRGRGLKPARVRVVAPGRDPAPPTAPVPELRHGRRIAVLCVGNWMPRKGILELLDAVARTPPDTVTLHLVGDELLDTSYGRAVRTRLGDASLADRVVRHGKVDATRVAALYRGADVFALPSTVEPYGTVIGEALAAGLPVVGWDAGNLPHLATHDREGLICRVGDVACLATALERLAADDELRARLAAGALHRGAQLPPWADTAAAFFGTLREAQAGSSRRV